jgi:predicted extracellular nuclease
MCLTTVAFYNVENLFDPLDAAHTLDKDFTPKGKKKWVPYRYNIKITKLGNAISKIGHSETQALPAIVGLAEVENKTVLKDLCASEALKDTHYEHIHFDSPDDRGIDVAMLYDPQHFKPLQEKAIQAPQNNPKNMNEERCENTRDVLCVSGLLDGEKIHVYINHWPSKRNGQEVAKRKRIQIAQTIQKDIAAIEESNPKVIVLGDFNDNPTDESIQNYLAVKGLKNTMLPLFHAGEGASKFYGQWMLFDQILLSDSFFSERQYGFKFHESKIFNPSFLTNPRGRHKGEPFRTYTGRYYQGGCSDHFPVYTLLKKKETPSVGEG